MKNGNVNGMNNQKSLVFWRRIVRWIVHDITVVISDVINFGNTECILEYKQRITNE